MDSALCSSCGTNKSKANVSPASASKGIKRFMSLTISAASKLAASSKERDQNVYPKRNASLNSPAPKGMQKFSKPKLSTKFCSPKLNTDDTMDIDHCGRIYHEEDKLKLVPENGMPSSMREAFSEERSQLSEMVQSLEADDVMIPGGREVNFLYVRTVLVSAGFNDESFVASTRWYSPSHPINPHLFYRIEEYYQDEDEQTNVSKKSMDTANRKLLFDLVDEFVCKIMKPPLLKIKPTKQNVGYMPSGKQVLKAVWDEICRSSEGDIVKYLADREMGNEDPWGGDDEDCIENVGYEVERYIFNNLLQDAILDFLSL